MKEWEEKDSTRYPPHILLLGRLRSRRPEAFGVFFGASWGHLGGSSRRRIRRSTRRVGGRERRGTLSTPSSAPLGPSSGPPGSLGAVLGGHIGKSWRDPGGLLGYFGVRMPGDQCTTQFEEEGQEEHDEGRGWRSGKRTTAHVIHPADEDGRPHYGQEGPNTTLLKRS